MKLYTRKGDDGSTGLFGGGRTSKSDARVAAYGEVDEANAAIGVAIAKSQDDEISTRLIEIQSDLFVLGAELATPAGTKPTNRIEASHVTRLEGWIDNATVEVAPLKSFVLPGGGELSAALHFARTVCRRAERATVFLASREEIRSEAICYLNRLSDLLFALARLANHRAGVPDTPWSD